MYADFVSEERVRVYKQLGKGQITREEAIKELKNLRLGDKYYE